MAYQADATGSATSIPLVVPDDVEEFVVTGITAIEQVGNCTRFTFHCEQAELPSGRTCHVVKVRLFGPTSAALSALTAIASFYGATLVHKVLRH